MTSDDVVSKNTLSYDHDGNTFTPVLRKKKRRPGKQTHQRTPIELYEVSKQELTSDSVWINTCTETIRNVLSNLPSEITSILCLGLGSPTESAQARFQLCFLLEVKESIFKNNVDICAFDPVFTFQDKNLLESLGIQILTENQHGKHALSKSTLAYMPHCDRELYENFLFANWTEEQLLNLVLIGNDLHHYEETHTLYAENPCISHLTPLLSTAVLPAHRAFPNAFSTTAVQYINRTSSLAGLTGALGTVFPNPNNAETIGRQ